MALGFVVARFGLAAPRTPLELSTGFGVALVVCGAVLMILATLRSRATTGAIDRDVYHPSPWLIQLVAGGLVGVATLLAAYLVLTV